MKDILNTILSYKRYEVSKRKRSLKIAALEEKIHSGEVPEIRPFATALCKHLAQHGIAIIAELKKASPSKGLLCCHYQPSKLAAQYEQNGAACLSVLTEEDFFLGEDKDLTNARKSCSLPVLRKDFIVDAYQIYESRVLGADCILLIAAALKEEQLLEFHQLATQLGLDVLIEISNKKELATALKSQTNLIGINNRNLRDFSINLETTIALKQQIPNDKIVVCESGIQDRSDIEKMLSHDIKVFLIGEALVKAENPGEKLKELCTQNK
jgi:indole-3-glycerol phosphate synthase